MRLVVESCQLNRDGSFSRLVLLSLVLPFFSSPSHPSSFADQCLPPSPSLPPPPPSNYRSSSNPQSESPLGRRNSSSSLVVQALPPQISSICLKLVCTYVKIYLLSSLSPQLSLLSSRTNSLPSSRLRSLSFLHSSPVPPTPLSPPPASQTKPSTSATPLPTWLSPTSFQGTTASDPGSTVIGRARFVCLRRELGRDVGVIRSVFQ